MNIILNNGKRIAVAFILFLALVVPLVTPAISVQAVISISQPSGWAQESVARAYELGLVPAHVQGLYQQATTRAEFAAFAVALYEHQRGHEITGYDISRFVDARDVNVAKAAHIGLVNGVDDYRFSPHREINRMEAATLLNRVAEALGHTTAVREAPFADISGVQDWARPGINWAYSTNVMGGVGSNRFNPTGAYTREQTMVSLVRVYDIVNGRVVIVPTPTPEPPPVDNTPMGHDEVVVLGQEYGLSGGANARLSFAQRRGNDWFIWSRGHASHSHRNYGISIDGAHKYVDGVHVATAFANTEMGVVSVATREGVVHLDLERLPRIRVAQLRLGSAFMNIDLDGNGIRRIEISVTEIDHQRTFYETGGTDLGTSGAPLTQYQNGELVLGGVHRGSSGATRGTAHLLEDTMSEFQRQVDRYRQRRSSAGAEVAQPELDTPVDIPRAPAGDGRRVVARAVR